MHKRILVCFLCLTVQIRQQRQRYSYTLGESDVAADGVLGQSGLFVDVAHGIEGDAATDVLDGVSDHRQTDRPRQLLTRSQQGLTEHAADTTQTHTAAYNVYV